MKKLIEDLTDKGVLQSPRIQEAFSAIDREDFVAPDTKSLAHRDEALPIASGQTISQPYVVAFMLEKLQPKPGDKILDIGAGSGWTAALLAHLVGPKGKVIAIEVLPELAGFGKTNITKYNFIEKGTVEVICANATSGYEGGAPYEGILVSAALPSKELPAAWKNQLKLGGKIVVPIQNSLWVFTKEHENHFKEKEYPGFVFVPFVPV